MFSHARLAMKLLLAVCLGCLAVGLIGSLSSDQVGKALRRLKAVEEPVDAAEEPGVPEGAEFSEEPFEDYGAELDETFNESEFIVEERNQTNDTFEGLPIVQLPVFWSGRRSVRGIESCGGRNVGYCNRLMYRAKRACGGSGCVLIVNPPGHRTRTPLHIHAYHYNGYGSSIKRRMSAKVCRQGGWHRGGFPCGGKAKFFRGFPPVFSVVGGNPIASVTAWPVSCGGTGTIVLVSYGCSIEHDICVRC